MPDVSTTPLDPKTFKPGDVLVHESSDRRVIIARRKDDNTGWWMIDGCGLADYAYIASPWKLVGHNSVHKCPTCSGSGVVTGE